MINGSVIAPFRHDSTWPDEPLRLFRSAVYYLHVHVPGRDAVNFLRELVLLTLRKHKRSETSTQWNYLKDACDKVIHRALDGNVKDEEMNHLANNLLVFANFLLIEDHGLESSSSLRFRTEDPARNEEHDEMSRAARERFLESVEQAYQSLENAIEGLRQPGGKLRGSLNLEGSDVLSPIPSSHHLIDKEDLAKGTIEITLSGASGAYHYEFRPHDPIGWEMTKGSRSKDRFLDDALSSPGMWRDPVSSGTAGTNV